MTAQGYEILRYRGKTLKFAATPLYDYMQRLPKARRPRFTPESTALWRGYVGEWEVRDGHLYLTGLKGWAWIGDDVVEVGLTDVFPWMKPPVLATWVTARLHSPSGRMRQYAHRGFASEFEKTRIFDVTRGKVDAVWLRIDPPAPIWYFEPPEGGRRRYLEDNCGDGELPDPVPPDIEPDADHFWPGQIEFDDMFDPAP